MKKLVVGFFYLLSLLPLRALYCISDIEYMMMYHIIRYRRKIVRNNLTSSFPDKNIFFTEGCAESFDSTRYNAWVLGEEYARSMIHDFNNGMVGFTDWNILLDETGGPNHVGNFCFAPVHADTRTG